MPKKSDVWKHFTRLTDDNGKTIVDKAKCNSCPKVLTQVSNNGTSNLWKHFNKFHKQQDGAAVGASSRSLAPPTSNPSGSGASKDSSSKPGMQKADKAANTWLAQMIVKSGYDPAIVDDPNFWFFAHCLNPEFEMPSRRDIEEICDGIGRLDLSWDGIYEDSRNRNFSLSVGIAKTMEQEVLYIACHYIDDFNGVRKKLEVLYAYELAPHDEYYHGPLSGLWPGSSHELIAGNIVSDIPQGAGLFMIACEEMGVTFVLWDLKERIKQALGPRMSKEPFCAIYMDKVIHSIADCLLPDLDFRNRMYSTVNNLKLTRQDRKDLLSEHGLDDLWEYNELWYSCYCSLEVLREGYSSRIATEDCKVIKILCDVWGEFYDAIKRISDPDEVTSHLCLAELFKLREALQSSELESATGHFEGGLMRAKAALDEAIQDSYLVWSIPLAMDPRYKIKYIEDIFKTAFGSEVAGDYIAKVKGNINDLYSNYDDGDRAIDTSAGSSAGSLLEQAWKKHRCAQAKTDLDRYLQDSTIPDTGTNVLDWWDTIGRIKYPQVAQMSWDALAMPTSSRLSSMQIAKVRSIIRGYSARPEEEDEEEHDDDDDDVDSDDDEEEDEEEHDDDDAMIEELNY